MGSPSDRISVDRGLRSSRDGTQSCCTACAAGSVSKGSQYQCLPCAPGRYSYAATACVECVAGSIWLVALVCAIGYCELCSSSFVVHDPHVLRGGNVHLNERHTDRRRFLLGLWCGSVFDRWRDVMHRLRVKLFRFDFKQTAFTSCFVCTAGRYQLVACTWYDGRQGVRG